MVRIGLLLGVGAALLTSAGSPLAAESYEAYLERLRVVCSVECLKPREFRRAARKQSKSDKGEMAVMMDVRDIRRDGENYILLSKDLRLSNLETLAILEGAGINTSGRDGVGGLPRGRAAPTRPDLIIIELDSQAVADFLRVPVGSAKPRPLFDANGDLLVEGDVDRKERKPTLAELSNNLINRRIAVRGTTRLEPTWIGGRLDYRRKQVSLIVDNADDLVVLPRYDEEGNPILDGPLASLAAQTGP